MKDFAPEKIIIKVHEPKFKSYMIQPGILAILKIIDEVHGIDSVEALQDIAVKLLEASEIIDCFQILYKKVEAFNSRLLTVLKDNNTIKENRKIDSYLIGVYKRLEFYSVLLLEHSFLMKVKVSVI